MGSVSPICLCTEFTRANPQSAKRQSSNQCLFRLLGSSRTKAAHKMFVKLTPEAFHMLFELCSLLLVKLKYS